jgi:hypothetical protein
MDILQTSGLSNQMNNSSKFDIDFFKYFANYQCIFVYQPPMFVDPEIGSCAVTESA